MSLRKSINGILKIYGYEVTKLDRLKELLEEEYKNVGENFRFLQIGANDGVQFDSLYYFVTTNPCSGVVVEPLSYYFDKLEKNYQNYPRIKPLKLAVHASEKVAKMHYVNPEKLDLLPEYAEGIGSLDPDHHKKSNTPSEFMVSEKVACMNLMDIVNNYNLLELSFLQVDAEGYDHEVIKMIDFETVKPRIIKYERASMNKQQQELVTILERQGYKIFNQYNDTLAYRISD